MSPPNRPLGVANSISFKKTERHNVNLGDSASVAGELLPRPLSGGWPVVPWRPALVRCVGFYHAGCAVAVSAYGINHTHLWKISQTYSAANARSCLLRVFFRTSLIFLSPFNAWLPAKLRWKESNLRCRSQSPMPYRLATPQRRGIYASCTRSS